MRANVSDIRVCYITKRDSNMCRPLSKTKTKKAPKLTNKACAELLRFHKTTARFNAAIRKAFPPTHKLARAMERNTSGLVNDAPGEIQSFVSAVEDACYLCSPERAQSFNDGVGQTIEEARVWAGRPCIDAYGDFQYTARVSWVENSLAVEVAVVAAAFFASVHALPGVQVHHLRTEEKSYMHKHAALLQEFNSAKFDPRPSVVSLLLLHRRFPSGVCRGIIEFVV